MDDSDKGSEGSVSGKEMGRAHELKLEIEALKLQIELEKLKSARVLQDATQAQSQTSGLGRYAKDLKAVLAPMPADDTMIPAWFKNADSLLRTLAIPEEMQGALILPFLNDKIRTSVVHQSLSGTLSYAELKERVLKALKLTPTEYRRRFLEIKKEAAESWSQLAARLETMFSSYLRSREVGSFEQLQALLIADRLKQLMPPEIRSYVTQNEMKGWLQAKDLAELAANFEESTLQNTSYREVTAKERPHIQLGRQNYARDLRRDRMLCFFCGEPGHIRRDCEWRYGRGPRTKEVSRTAALNEHTREISSLAWRSEKPVANSVSTGDKQVQIFVGEGVCTARIDSGADITVIRAGKVPKELRGRSGDRMKLTGPFGRNGLDTATTFCDDNKARDAVGEEPNKGEDEVCCEVTLEPAHESEDSGDNKISKQEADPASNYGELASVAKVVTAGHPAHMGSSGEKERLISLTASAFSKKRMHDELLVEARHVLDAVRVVELRLEINGTLRRYSIM
ncbi:hypothetical protein HPB50_000351 [Hyalomma asiaticum]|uniref:Uncharacterized protein n=1 Tax=Hyalomma asiaticum TaxID=266040 RepID=A0ACB7SDH1_HYAAI|nr:hypothetical protein HPB50_000351 [Hyalomma asiaticum]